MSLPLAGLKVLDTTAYISGPYASALLASLGAEVVKVEPPSGDAFRRGAGISSKYFCQYNAGKKSIVVDLKTPEGVALIKSMVPHFDVFMENSRPGKMAAMGLGREALVALNPQLVYSSVSGFGDGGPFRDRAAYDSIGQSMSGFYSIMNDEGNARLSGTCLADLITALVSATGILAALAGRGIGAPAASRVVETSLLEAMSAVTIDAVAQYFDDGRKSPTRSSRHPQAQNFCLLCEDGGSITLHLSSSQKFWQALCKAMDQPELATRPEFATYNDRDRNYWKLKPQIEAAFVQRPRAEWEEILAAADVPFAPVLTVGENLAHPQSQWLELLEPEVDGQSLVRAPWRFGGARPTRPVPAPDVGAQTRDVLQAFLSAERIEALLAAGVVRDPAWVATSETV